jgi:zinc transport system substrate-binding protein
MTIFYRLCFACLLYLQLLSPSYAKIKAVASIQPLHSILSNIMADTDGEAHSILEGAASPHYYTLTPSKAQSIENADIIFWIDPAIESFLTKPLESLGSNGRIIQVSELDGLTRIPLRESKEFEGHHHHHGHGDDHHGHNEHSHDHHGHDKHSHDHHGHDKHSHDHHGHDKHSHDHHEHDHSKKHKDHHHDAKNNEEAIDMHIWLDPNNASIIARAMAENLSEIDPDNATIYQTNLQNFDENLSRLSDELRTQLATVQDLKFLTFHDAYHYFEDYFGLESSGTVTLHDAVKPGAKTIRNVQERLQSNDIDCLFTEPQFDGKIATQLLDGTNVKSAMLDPLGSDLEQGSHLYAQILRNMADAFATCQKN